MRLDEGVKVGRPEAQHAASEAHASDSAVVGPAAKGARRYIEPPGSSL